MSPWVAFLLTLSLIILVHEWGHFVMARRVGVRVERFSLGFGPRLVRVSRGGTEYALSLVPLGGYVKMAGESSAEDVPKKPWEYRSRTVGERSLIVLAGPFVNYLVGFLLFVFIFMVGAPVLTTRVGQVLEGYPAAESGLQSADQILSINGQPVQNWEEVTRAIHAQTDEVRLEVDRQGTRLSFTITPQVRETTNLFGMKVRLGMVGVAPAEEFEVRRYPPHQAVVKAGQRIWTLTLLTCQAIVRLATGGLSIKESVTGPIGIFYITSAVAQQGWISLLQLMAILSASLGLFNLLPIPVLDGGHLAFLLLERMKGRPLSARTQEMVTRLGLGLLTFFIVVVTYNDWVKFRLSDRIFPFLK